MVLTLLLNSHLSMAERCMYLDGEDDYVQISDSDSIDFDTDDNFTVSVWISFPAVQKDMGNNDNDILEKWSGASGYPYVIRYLNQGDSTNKGKVIVARYDGTQDPKIISTTSLNDG